nr:protein eva-1 homolog C-like isoform X2 [Pongo abelii]
MNPSSSTSTLRPMAGGPRKGTSAPLRQSGSPLFVPKNILAVIDPAIANLKPSLKQKHGINFDPIESKVLRKDGILVSNSLATFAYIRVRSMNQSFLEC